MVASKRQANSNRRGQQQEDSASPQQHTQQRKKQQHGTHSSRSKQKKKSEQQQPTALTHAFGDLCVTALWVLCSSVFAEGADWLSSKTKLGPFTTGTTITIVALVAFAPICNLFWGAIFNPVHNAALLVCGRGEFVRNALRMAGQLLGALLGSLAAVTLIPEQYQGKFLLNSGGLRDGIHIGLGFVCEAGLGLAVNMLFLYSIVAKNRTLAFWTPLGATVLLGWVGSYFTGPSLNPVVSFCWYWRYQQHSRAEHLLVFWAAPFCGALLAGLAFRWYEKWSSKSGRAAAKKSK